MKVRCTSCGREVHGRIHAATGELRPYNHLLPGGVRCEGRLKPGEPIHLAPLAEWLPVEPG